MALIPCPKCAKIISDKVKNCIYCGCVSIKEKREEKKNKKTKKQKREKQKREKRRRDKKRGKMKRGINILSRM